MEAWHYFIAIGGGFLAGVINTLAGSGSAITMSILMLLFQLPENVANGTNRIGVLVQSIVGTATFYKEGKLPSKNLKAFVIPTIIGAMLGVWCAIVLPNKDFRLVFTIMIVAMLGVVLVKPKRWILETPQAGKVTWYTIPLFLAIGFYGGFIQMGVGILLLAGLVLGAKYNMIEANGIKLLIVCLYTILAMAIFAWQGLIDWRIGGIIAIGQAVGGWVAARFATRNKQAAVWAHRLLVLVILWSAFRLLSEYFK